MSKGFNKKQLSPKELYLELVRDLRSFKIRKPDKNRSFNLVHGWMLPTLVDVDDILWHRWDYWFKVSASAGVLPDNRIPEIDFRSQPDERTFKMLKNCLNAIPNHGNWEDWSSPTYIEYFVEWILYGFGYLGQAKLPKEPPGCDGASDRLAQIFYLPALQGHPYDYFGELMAMTRYGKATEFYPTPFSVAELMTRITMAGIETEDHRMKTSLDPCTGTGRIALFMSNYTLRVTCQDIHPFLAKTALVNFYLYAPWLAKPIPWMNHYSLYCHDFLTNPLENPITGSGLQEWIIMQSMAAQISDNISGVAIEQGAGGANGSAAGYLGDSIHDNKDWWQVYPIAKRIMPLEVERMWAHLFLKAE